MIPIKMTLLNILQYKAYEYVFLPGVTGITGPNGAGKTTTFYMITGIVAPDGGEVIFDRKDITKLPIHKRARAGIGYLSQEPSIFRKLTVEENIMAILETLDFPRKERKRRLDELLGLEVSLYQLFGVFLSGI